MNTNQIIDVFNLDPFMSKYKSYCLPSDFLDKIQGGTHTIIIVNSSPSNIRNTGHWLCIFQTTKTIEFFDPLGFPYTFYGVHIKTYIESSGKPIIQNRKRVQDLSTKSCGFHALLYFVFRCRGYTYKQFLNIYVDNPRLNDFMVENILSDLYNIDFSALRVKCFKNVCKFVY